MIEADLQKKERLDSNKTAVVTDHWRQRSAKCVALLVEPLKAVGRELGYNLLIHGSLVRDIDMVAIPWTKDAVKPRVLAEAIQSRTIQLNGIALNRDREGAANPEWFDDGCPEHKPHGRLCWVFHLGGGPYIDLSVMPPLDPPRDFSRWKSNG